MLYNQSEIVVYVCRRSLRCWLTRRLLRREGCRFEVVDVTDDPELCSWLAHFTGRKTMPYVFIDHRPVGGFGEIKSLEHSGILKQLVQGEV